MTAKDTDKPSASLKQILERSKLLNNRILPQDLPSIKRGLDQIELQSQKLSSKTAAHDESVDIRAHYFLAQGGVDTQVLLQELGTIHLGESTEHRKPIQDTDIEAYLEQAHTDTIMDIMEDSRQKIMNDTHSLFQEDIDGYWRDMRNSLNTAIEDRYPHLNPSTIHLSKEAFDPSRIVNT